MHIYSGTDVGITVCSPNPVATASDRVTPSDRSGDSPPQAAAPSACVADDTLSLCPLTTQRKPVSGVIEER